MNIIREKLIIPGDDGMRSWVNPLHAWLVEKELVPWKNLSMEQVPYNTKSSADHVQVWSLRNQSTEQAQVWLLSKKKHLQQAMLFHKANYLSKEQS